ncbi:MAG: AMP-binding protein [Actinobacteria bacterium]|nr:AMP-binding protein [Actinomycetota bacterium]
MQALFNGSTLVDGIKNTALTLSKQGGSQGITFVANDHKLLWSALYDKAISVAGNLQKQGIGVGDRVALLGPTSYELVLGIEAIWLAGGCVVVLPLPMRLASLDEFILQTKSKISHTQAKLVLISRELLEFMPIADDTFAADSSAGLPGAVVELDKLLSDSFESLSGESNNLSGCYKEPDISTTDLAVLQFTSGSTSDPKGVMLPHAQVVAQINSAAQAIEFDPGQDVMLGWVPLYHDMGLIGFLASALFTGVDLVLASAQDFMVSPGAWMGWASKYKATITAAPNFAYALAARALKNSKDDHLDLDLSSLRIALNGAEPIDPTVVENFCKATEPFGFNPGAIFCAFGMAEATLAATFPKAGEGMKYDVVDRRMLEEELVVVPVDIQPGRLFSPQDNQSDAPRVLVHLGRPIPNLDIRICDTAKGTVLNAGMVGEVELRGASITPGYWGRQDINELTFHDGWLRTGDLGYMTSDGKDGELVVCGRIKDVIIVGGRNVFPEDIERAASSVPGVREGNVIAFGVRGRKERERIVVVAETRHDKIDMLKAGIAKKVRDAVGLPTQDVVLVAPGTLPKTSSGKLQRSLCRMRYLESALQPLYG